jgi:hypothetical protein|tara:strand:- start:6773 stop:6883 length:111 start_codon:yes stop_codon:yes gene_type:complete
MSEIEGNQRDIDADFLLVSDTFSGGIVELLVECEAM